MVNALKLMSKAAQQELRAQDKAQEENDKKFDAFWEKNKTLFRDVVILAENAETDKARYVMVFAGSSSKGGWFAKDRLSAPVLRKRAKAVFDDSVKVSKFERDYDFPPLQAEQVTFKLPKTGRGSHLAYGLEFQLNPGNDKDIYQFLERIMHRIEINIPIIEVENIEGENTQKFLLEYITNRKNTLIPVSINEIPASNSQKQKKTRRSLKTTAGQSEPMFTSDDTLKLTFCSNVLKKHAFIANLRQELGGPSLFVTDKLQEADLHIIYPNIKMAKVADSCLPGFKQYALIDVKSKCSKAEVHNPYEPTEQEYAELEKELTVKKKVPKHVPLTDEELNKKYAKQPWLLKQTLKSGCRPTKLIETEVEVKPDRRAVLAAYYCQNKLDIPTERLIEIADEYPKKPCIADAADVNTLKLPILKSGFILRDCNELEELAAPYTERSRGFSSREI